MASAAALRTRGKILLPRDPWHLKKPTRLMTLEEINEDFAVLGQLPASALRFLRFPKPASFVDMTTLRQELGGKLPAPSSTQAGILRQLLVRLKADMCKVDGAGTALPLGAPVGYERPGCSAAWGGVSLFVPHGEQGRLAWRYVYKVMKSASDGLDCKSTSNPLLSVPPPLREAFVFVYDRPIARTWANLEAERIADADDLYEPVPAPALPGADGALRDEWRAGKNAPLGYHVSLTVKAETPTYIINDIANCVGWDADPYWETIGSGSAAPPSGGGGGGGVGGSFGGGSAAPPPSGGGGGGGLPGDSSIASAASLPRSGTAAPRGTTFPGIVPGTSVPDDAGAPGPCDVLYSPCDLTPEEDPDVEDTVIGDVVLLLLTTLSSAAPEDLCIDALLYVFFLKHNQETFSGRLDRIVSIDDGHCAKVLLLASSLAYPEDRFDSDEWAHASVPQILRAAEAFLARGVHDGDHRTRGGVCSPPQPV
jgi:hypothetical protein